MAEYWKPKELQSTLPPLLVLDEEYFEIKELPSTLGPLVININSSNPVIESTSVNKSVLPPKE
jgi:hypothetical protein